MVLLSPRRDLLSDPFNSLFLYHLDTEYIPQNTSTQAHICHLALAVLFCVQLRMFAAWLSATARALRLTRATAGSTVWVQQRHKAQQDVNMFVAGDVTHCAGKDSQ
jgi:hypothetical protein